MGHNRRQLPLIGAKMLADAGAVVIASFFALYFRYDGRIPTGQYHVWHDLVPTLVLCRIGSLYAITAYRLQWRFTSLTDFWYVLQAQVLGTAVFGSVVALQHQYASPVFLLISESYLSLSFLMAMRVSVRVLRNRVLPSSRRGIAPYRKVLVVGAGDAGQRMVRYMKEDGTANLKPVGLVDDDPAKQGRLIHGVPVLGVVSDIERISCSHQVDQILIAIPSLSGAGISEIVRQCATARADLTILPSLPQIVGTGAGTREIRKVRVEDLMDRPPTRVDMEKIAAYTTGQRILVTGAGGSIGSELCRQIVGLNPEQMILLGNGENSLYWIEHELRMDFRYQPVTLVADIKDRRRLEEVFRTYRPTVVFHAAAHKHVPLMEANPGEAVKNNVFGTRNLAELSIAYGVNRFVMISTDKAVNPTSVMGATKRIAEMEVQSLAQRIEEHRLGDRKEDPLDLSRAVTRFSSVRFGNVLGSNGSVIPTMQRQIEKGGPVTVTHPEMVRYFMTIPEAVQLVIQAGSMGLGGEIFILDMGKPVKIVDLAWNLIRLSGLVPNVDIEVKVTGIRPGEKLYEEVLTAEEGTTVTEHEKIFAAKASWIDRPALEQGLCRLEQSLREGDTVLLRQVLADLVPTYHPSPTVPDLPVPEPRPAPAAERKKMPTGVPA